MGEHWNWNESAQQLTTQDSGVQNATKAQTIVDFSQEHPCSTYMISYDFLIFFFFFERYYFSYFRIFSSKKSKKKKTREKNRKQWKQRKKRKNKCWPQDTFSQLKTKCRLSYWRETQKKKVRKKRKKKKHKQINKKKRKDQKKIKKDNMFWVFFWPFFLPPDGFVPSKFKWWYYTSIIWIAGHCLFLSLGFLLYLRYAIDVLEYGSQKSY